MKTRGKSENEKIKKNKEKKRGIKSQKGTEVK